MQALIDYPRLLFDCGKDSVVLYVGHENSAQRVYDRVGFAGLCGKDKPDGVEDSVEECKRVSCERNQEHLEGPLGPGLEYRSLDPNSLIFQTVPDSVKYQSVVTTVSRHHAL